MNTSHRFITALVAVGALFAGSSAVAQQPRPTLQGLQDQVNNTYTKEQIDDMLEGIVPAAVPRTGQTTCYDTNGTIDCRNTGQDGDKLAGVTSSTPRFVDNGNGTVTDKLTGLIWLKNARCRFRSNTVNFFWQEAFDVVNALADGQCGLTDGSTAGQWRLPNVKELQSLIDYGRFNPALPAGHPFTGSMSTGYWSSSSSIRGNQGTFVAWVVSIGIGDVEERSKTFAPAGVWPVRNEQ